jgi:hypothetical protein
MRAQCGTAVFGGTGLGNLRMKSLLANDPKFNRIFDSRRGRHYRCTVSRVLRPAGDIRISISEEKDAAGDVRYPRLSLACTAGTHEIVCDGVANAQV